MYEFQFWMLGRVECFPCRREIRLSLSFADRMDGYKEKGENRNALLFTFLETTSLFYHYAAVQCGPAPTIALLLIYWKENQMGCVPYFFLLFHLTYCHVKKTKYSENMRAGLYKSIPDKLLIKCYIIVI